MSLKFSSAEQPTTVGQGAPSELRLPETRQYDETDQVPAAVLRQPVRDAAPSAGPGIGHTMTGIPPRGEDRGYGFRSRDYRNRDRDYYDRDRDYEGRRGRGRDRDEDDRADRRGSFRTPRIVLNGTNVCNHQHMVLNREYDSLDQRHNGLLADLEDVRQRIEELTQTAARFTAEAAELQQLKEAVRERFESILEPDPTRM